MSFYRQIIHVEKIYTASNKKAFGFMKHNQKTVSLLIHLECGHVRVTKSSAYYGQKTMICPTCKDKKNKNIFRRNK